MSARVGLEIGAAEVRATLVRRGVVKWRREEPVAADGIAAAIRRVLAELPRARFGMRPALGVTIGAPRSQARRVEGLPPLPTRALLSQVVRQNPNAFFLRGAGHLTIPDVHRFSDGTVWGSAFDAATIDEVVEGAAALGFTVAAIGPSAERCHSAVEITARSPLSWKPAMSAGRSKILRRVAVAASVAVVVVAAAAAVAAPAVRATVYERQASRELGRLRDVELEASRAAADLRRVTQVLDAVTAFDADRGHITRLLGDLSQAIPESTAILTLRVDSVEGSFVALAPHVMDVLPELAVVHAMSAPRVTGSVTREIVGGVRLERATIRFRRPRAKPAPAVTPKP